MTDFKNSYTWKEIVQQPSIWREEMQIITENFPLLYEFIHEFKEGKSKKIKVIFTGSGSSEFVGNTICSYINSKANFDVLSVPATDIVSMPETYLEKDTPTIVISCARSGNSPESVATVNLANQIIKDVRHIFITCNKDGKLAKISEKNENSYLLLMPEKSNDLGFAMTGSFSSMVVAGVLIFAEKETQKLEESLNIVSNIVEENINTILERAKKIVDYKCERIVYLGDGPMKGIAEEVGLKILELAAGQIVSTFNTFLGFRHGPKSIVNDKTAIICMMSKDDYTRMYEIDLLREFKNDQGNKKIIVLDYKNDKEIAGLVDEYFFFENNELLKVENIFLSLLYLVQGQLVSLVQSASLDIQPDNPCPTGEVNRVVKGVIIHEYNK